MDNTLNVSDHKGAGVLMYSIRGDGQIFLLLARDAYMHRGSRYLWSGFEGKSKDGEDDVDTATREWREEALGLFLTEGCDYSENLRDNRFKRKLLVEIHNTDSTVSRYVTFLVELPWDATLVERFAERRKSLSSIFNAVSTINKLGRGPLGDVSNTEHGSVQGDAPVPRLKEELPILLDTNRDMLQPLGCIMPTERPAGLKVGREFMEKERLSFWNVESLKRLKKSGRLGYHIKPRYIPTISRVLDFLDRMDVTRQAPGVGRPSQLRERRYQSRENRQNETRFRCPEIYRV